VAQKSPPIKSHNSSHTELHINLEILNKLGTNTLGYTYFLVTTVFERKQDGKNTSRYNAVSKYCTFTVQLRLFGRWLSGSPIIRIGFALRVNPSRIQQN